MYRISSASPVTQVLPIVRVVDQQAFPSVNYRTTSSPYLSLTQPCIPAPAMADTSPSVTLLSRVKALLPRCFSRLFPRRRTAIAQCNTVSPPLSSTSSTFPSGAIRNDSQSYYDLTKRLQKLSPPDLNWLGSDDVQIIDTAPFAAGGFSDVWKGTFKGRPVAVKSLRCYSSPEFVPAEIGIVSLSRSL